MNIRQIESAQLEFALENAEFWPRELGKRTRNKLAEIRKILAERQEELEYLANSPDFGEPQELPFATTDLIDEVLEQNGFEQNIEAEFDRIFNLPREQQQQVDLNLQWPANSLQQQQQQVDFDLAAPPLYHDLQNHNHQDFQQQPVIQQHFIDFGVPSPPLGPAEPLATTTIEQYVRPEILLRQQKATHRPIMLRFLNKFTQVSFTTELMATQFTTDENAYISVLPSTLSGEFSQLYEFVRREGKLDLYKILTLEGTYINYDNEVNAFTY